LYAFFNSCGVRRTTWQKSDLIIHGNINATDSTTGRQDSQARASADFIKRLDGLRVFSDVKNASTSAAPLHPSENSAN
jgi:hypothetical protein